MAFPTGGGRIAKEIDEYMLRVYKTDTKALEPQRLPKFWNTKDRSRHLRLSHFALSITYSGGFSERHDSNYTNNEAASVRADAPIPLTTGVYYFEITISTRGSNGSIAIGVATKASNLSKLPGTEHSSFGYHSEGSVFHGSTASSTKFGPRFGENDTVGCGVDFISRSLFFTRNGVFLGKAFEGEIPASPGTRLYPTIGLQGRGTRLSTNFGQRPFSYAFEAHIKRERVLQENQLIERICKEEFAGPKMRELVSGYLVHHGYVSTAQAFSRWNSVPNFPIPSLTSTSNHKENPSPVRITDTDTRSAKSCESYLDSPQTEPSTSSPTSIQPNIARRHSDSACLIGTSSSPTGMLPLPGLASMLHRRRLRALCRRCQYGRAAATLNRLYPQVLERCPELLVQLRCRQLIEMMRRHAVRRGRSSEFDLASECNSATAPPKVQKISGFQNVRSGCCVSTDRVAANNTDGPKLIANEINQNDLIRNMMDVDSEGSGRPTTLAPVCSISNHVPKTTTETDQKRSNLDSDDLLLLWNAVDDMDEPNVDRVDVDDGNDDDDDDGFGMDDDTGVSLNTLLPSSAMKPTQTISSSPCSPVPSTTDLLAQSVNAASCILTPSTSSTCHMDVDEELGPPTETNLNASTTKRRPQSMDGGFTQDTDTGEMRCLLRHVQFGRSLVNLVKQVRAKVGGLSLETERLLQQSVSLLAYPSPTANSCPLRGLLDPVWRDTIASVINSAVLKAHDLPVQPALEQGLLALQRCFQDQYFVEAQTLGHFLLYHLTPSQLDAAERAAALIATASTTDTQKSEHVTSPPASSTDEQFLSTERPRGARRTTVLNGHGSTRRRRSTRRGRSHAPTAVAMTTTDESQTHSAYDTEECSSSSSMEETLQKNEEDDEEDDDEDEEEDEEVERCNVDDSDEHDNEDDDDDDADGGQGTTASRNRRRRTRDTDSSTGAGSHDSSIMFRGEQSPNRTGSGGGSGRQQFVNRTYGLSTVVHTQNSALRTRRALIARFCPSIFLDDSHTRVMSSPTLTSHSSSCAGPNNHSLRIQSTQAIPRFRSQPAATRSHNVCLSDLNGSINPNLGLDSAFHGPVSISNPYHRDLLSAVNDALKVYAGSLLLPDEEQTASCSLTPLSYRSSRGSGPPPPPSGGGTCAP